MTNKSPDWHRTRSTYLAGRSELDGVDALAAEMEARWGAGRLRLLVAADWREKFDRQRYLLNQAIWHGDLETVRTQSRRMTVAWQTLDRLATEGGASRLDPDAVWEVGLEDGSVAAIVPDTAHAKRVIAEGRIVRVYTLDEIARLLSANRSVSAVKEFFPGAEVVAVRRTVGDPLDGFSDSLPALDDPLDDPLDDIMPLPMESA